MSVVAAVLLVILRIILIILCIVAALLCVILFVPVRYHLSGSRDESGMEGGVEVTFLFRAIVFRFRAAKAGNSEAEKKTQFLIFGIDPKERKQKRLEKKKAQRHSKRRAYLEKLKKEDPEKYEELRREARQRKTGLQNEEAPGQEPGKNQQEHKTESGQKGSEKTEKKSRNGNKTGRLREVFTAVLHFLVLLPFKVIEKAGLFFAKLCGLANGLSYWISFLTSPVFLNAFHHLAGSIVRLVRALLPERISGRVEMGFEDPSLTGKILAFSCAFLHASGPDFYVVPDFEEKKFLGHVACDGHIRLILPARLLVSLFLDRNVRQAYHVFKNRKEETA